MSGDIRVLGDAIHRAMTKLPERQTMNRLTGALHAIMPRHRNQCDPGIPHRIA